MVKPNCSRIMQNERMKMKIAGLATAFAATVTVAATQIDLSKLPPPATQPGVTYVKEVRPLFEASCVRCHGAQRPKGGLRLDSVEGVLKGSKDGKVVTPGNSEKSKLVLAISQLDPECAIVPIVTKPIPDAPRVALNNSSGFGGTNVSIALRKWE